MEFGYCFVWHVNFKRIICWVNHHSYGPSWPFHWASIIFDCYVSVKSKLQHTPPPQANPRAFDSFENYCSNSPLPGEKAVQMPHTRVHSPLGHFTGTKMTERRWKCLQLSNKIFINKYNKNWETLLGYLLQTKVSCKAAEIAATRY